MSRWVDELYIDIQKRGPTRVVINKYGEAVTPEQAKGEFGITPDIVFIRHDGWSLGAPKEFVEVARDMWRADWIAAVKRPFGPYDDVPLSDNTSEQRGGSRFVRTHSPLNVRNPNTSYLVFRKVDDTLRLTLVNPKEGGAEYWHYFSPSVVESMIESLKDFLRLVKNNSSVVAHHHTK